MQGIFTRRFWLLNEPVFLGLNPRQALVHFFAIPMFLAFLSGWPQVGRTISWPKHHALGLWIGLSFSGWWMNDLVTRLLSGPLRRRGAPLWVTLTLGVIVASIPSDIVMRQWVISYQGMFPSLPLDRPLPDWRFIPTQFLKTHLYAYLTWPLVMLGLFHLWKMPCFGYLPASPVGTAEGVGEGAAMPNAPSFMDKLPPAVQGRVLALASEQHYLRVFTDRGEALILYRLSDAVRELGGKGLQVHRSFWVASGAVRTVVGSKAAPRLELVNGLDVPVSRSYRQSVEQAGFLRPLQPDAPAGASGELAQAR